jgi:hypothetical protein
MGPSASACKTSFTIFFPSEFRGTCSTYGTHRVPHRQSQCTRSATSKRTKPAVVLGDTDHWDWGFADLAPISVYAVVQFFFHQHPHPPAEGSRPHTAQKPNVHIQQDTTTPAATANTAMDRETITNELSTRKGPHERRLTPTRSTVCVVTLHG